MFSKEERKIYHQAYWSAFKKYMNQYKNSRGKRINWLNYPTHLKEIYVRLHVDNQQAHFSIDIQCKDKEIRLLIWEQFEELRKVLENEMDDQGQWSKIAYNSAGQEISQIIWEINKVNIYQQNDQPIVFDFLKNKLISFDTFYQTYKDILIGLLK